MATELTEMHLAELHARAAAAGIDGYRLLRREQLIERLADADEPGGEPDADESATAAETGEPESEADTDEMVVVEATVLDDADPEPVEVGPLGPEGGDEGAGDEPTEAVRGVLELTRQRYGFLRLGGLAPTDADVYVSAAQVRRCELRPGDEVAGPAREPRRGERHPALVHVDTVNGEEPLTEARPEFDDFAAVLPERRISLEKAADDVLVALGRPAGAARLRPADPAPRRAALRPHDPAALAGAGRSGDETARVIALLIDERPEEATAWREPLPVAEFAIATAELAPVEQVRIAELALERARRLAEAGPDAVVVCDSLSRLAVAAGDVAEVKRLFGSGPKPRRRRLADRDRDRARRRRRRRRRARRGHDRERRSSSSTPSSRRPGSRRRSAPPTHGSRTRTGSASADELEAARKLRSLLTDLDPREAADLLRERIEATASNAELLAALASAGRRAPAQEGSRESSIGSASRSGCT